MKKNLLERKNTQFLLFTPEKSSSVQRKQKMQINKFKLFISHNGENRMVDSENIKCRYLLALDKKRDEMAVFVEQDELGALSFGAKELEDAEKLNGFLLCAWEEIDYEMLKEEKDGVVLDKSSNVRAYSGGETSMNIFYCNTRKKDVQALKVKVEGVSEGGTKVGELAQWVFEITYKAIASSEDSKLIEDMEREKE